MLHFHSKDHQRSSGAPSSSFALVGSRDGDGLMECLVNEQCPPGSVNHQPQPVRPVSLCCGGKQSSCVWTLSSPGGWSCWLFCHSFFCRKTRESINRAAVTHGFHCFLFREEDLDLWLWMVVGGGPPENTTSVSLKWNEIISSYRIG